MPPFYFLLLQDDDAKKAKKKVTVMQVQLQRRLKNSYYNGTCTEYTTTYNTVARKKSMQERFFLCTKPTNPFYLC